MSVAFISSVESDCVDVIGLAVVVVNGVLVVLLEYEPAVEEGGVAVVVFM